MKTSELTGALLDLWVARAMKLEPISGEPEGLFYWKEKEGWDCSGWWCASTDWRQGGPIIERERIDVTPLSRHELIGDLAGKWMACIHCAPVRPRTQFGDTPLIAAMRVYVASVYGDAVPDQPSVAVSAIINQ